jgi:hypothetical protein
VHPPPLPAPPAPPAYSQPNSPTNMLAPKPSLRRLAELDHPLSAPLPHRKPSMAAVQRTLVSSYYPDLNMPPALSLDDYAKFDHYAKFYRVPSPRPTGLSTPLMADAALSLDSSTASPRARNCRSLSPDMSSARTLDHAPARADSAPPARSASPECQPAVTYPTVPRIRPCAHIRAAHACVLRSYELVMRQQPIHARMCGVGDKCRCREIACTGLCSMS